MMFALRKESNNAWDLQITEVDVPDLRPGEVLLESQAIGLCGSDVHAARSDEGYEWLKPPLVLGHEVTGSIVKTSGGNTHLVGRRAAVIAIDGCRNCEICEGGNTNYCSTRNCVGIHSDGGLATYLRIEADRLYILPQDCALEPTLAALLEPAAIAIQAVSRLEMDLQGKSVGVSGPGAIGIFSGLVLLRAGARVQMYGPAQGAESRMSFAKEVGMQIGGLGDECTVDAWVEASGAPAALNSALERLRLNARIVVPAMFPNISGITMTHIVRKGLTLSGTYGYVRADFEAAHRLIHDYQDELRRMITVFSFGDVVEALELTSRAELIKAVVVQEKDYSK